MDEQAQDKDIKAVYSLEELVLVLERHFSLLRNLRLNFPIII